MKTEQEQIEKIMCMFNKLNRGDYCVDNCYGCCGDEKIDITCHDVVVNFIQSLMQAGYGDISEYKAEREMLGSQIKVLKQRLNDKYIEIDNLNRDYSNAFERLKSQQQEIDRLKAENKELTKVVSSKVYDLIDNTKEIADAREAWEQQAKIDVLNELKDKMFEREYMGVKYKERIFYESEINDMIADVQNGEDKS